MASAKSDTDEPVLCILNAADVLAMNVDELRTELQHRSLDCTGLTKPALQAALLANIGVFTVPPPAADANPATPTESDTEIEFAPNIAASIHRPTRPEIVRARDTERISIHDDHMSTSSDLQLQFRRLQLEERRLQFQMEERRIQIQAEAEAQQRQQQHELALRRLELEAARVQVPAQRQTPAFRVESAIKLIPKFNEHDIESFLISFEKIAMLNAFPEDKYAAILQAHLTGKALKVFTELTAEECQDYPTLKAALLNAYAVVPEVYRKRFRGMHKANSETYSEFAFRLSTQFRRWLESEDAFSDLERLRDLLQLEEFQSKLDSDLRIWLVDQKPRTLSEAAKLADQYVAVRKADRSERVSDWKHKSYRKYSPPRPKTVSTESSAETSHKNVSTATKQSVRDPVQKNAKVVCYYCKKPGHTLAVCRKRLAKMMNNPPSDAPVQLVSTLDDESRNTILTTSIDKHDNHRPDPRFESHCVDAVIIRPDQSVRTVHVLRDTGALQSLVSSQWLTDSDYHPTEEVRLIRGITGDIISVPLIEVTLKSALCSGTYLCGLVPTLPPGIAILVGNDMCPDPSVADVNVVTRAQAALMKTKETQPDETSNSTETVPKSHSDVTPVVDSDHDIDVSALFTDSSVDKVDRAELIRLQQCDPDISSLFDLVDKPDHYYTLRSGVLVRRWKDHLSPQEAEIHQVVVPTLLRPKLLQLAHDIPAAGHLGVAKTKNRLLRHFYWPSISRDTKDFCRSCDVCQRLGKGTSVPPAPLHSLPLVSEPFCQVAMDIVGPLPVCKDSGNRFILTVLDLCTHYPEAVPLQNHTAQSVAQALTTVFSRFGFPQEVLSDQGTDFMSELMQIFLNDFGINHIRSSPYRPQTNGACEKFNGTMKTMLRSLTDQFPDSWDLALPWILFAYREVPVETLGCSPFDLLFGRSVAGPLSLLKNTWLQDTDLGGAKQNVVEFILNTRDRLRHGIDAATKHADNERSKAKRWYDRRACQREFDPGDKVLVLLPVQGKPLEAKFHGPYLVEQRLGPVDYVISTPDRRKTKRVCHINLLKKYVERDPRLIDKANNVPSDVMMDVCLVPDELMNCHPSSNSTCDLTAQQKSELNNILTEFSDVFSDVPGKTNLAVHHIALQPNTPPVRCTPYRLNPEKTKALKQELDNLLQLGIIEESNSPFASPVVLVPKSDGTLRLCTDFRKVNAVTVADPFPLPRVDDLIDRIGKAKFLTKLDMTRGYWQVPLDDPSVPISAFVTPFGHFQWRYMPFGLRNAPATFSRLVNKLLLGLESFCAVYLDDIILFSDSWEEHMKHLKVVLTRIRNANLTLSPQKCHFAVAEVDYLGHHVGMARVQPRAKKVEALLSYPTPVNRKQLQSFLGLAGYYRKFVPHYAHIAAALSDLLKKGARFVWTPEADKAFLDLKSRLSTRPVLRPPNYLLPFSMSVDASDLAIGSVLFQTVEDIDHPICFYSKKLDRHQRNYSTIEKEAFALVLSVRVFSVYFGSNPVKVYTDHNPLTFLQRMASHNQKLLRWSLEIQQYNLEILHRSGKDNLLPDLLSRTPDSAK